MASQAQSTGSRLCLCAMAPDRRKTLPAMHHNESTSRACRVHVCENVHSFALLAPGTVDGVLGVLQSASTD